MLVDGWALVVHSLVVELPLTPWTPNTVVTIIGQAVVLVAKLAGPILVATLVVGLTVSLFQAVTTVQEFTLTFLPKLVVVAAILAISGHWMVIRDRRLHRAALQLDSRHWSADDAPPPARRR